MCKNVTRQGDAKGGSGESNLEQASEEDTEMAQVTRDENGENYKKKPGKPNGTKNRPRGIGGEGTIMEAFLPPKKRRIASFPRQNVTPVGVCAADRRNKSILPSVDKRGITNEMESNVDNTAACSICNKALENGSDRVLNVRKKGISTLIGKSRLFGDEKWMQWSDLSTLVVHDNCRKWYATASIKSAAAKASSSSAASQGPSSGVPDTAPSENDFNFRDLCLLCGKPWDRKNKKGYMIKHDFMREKYLDLADRRDDAMSIDVISRLQGVKSLTSVGARYHKKCSERFYTIPSKKSGRPLNDSPIDSTFQLVAD